MARGDVREVAELPVGQLGAADAVPFGECGVVGVPVPVSACSAAPAFGPPVHGQLAAIGACDAGCQVLDGQCVFFEERKWVVVAVCFCEFVCQPFDLGRREKVLL